MIKKYVYGDPFFTDAVVKDIEKSEDKLPYFDVKDGVFTHTLFPRTISYMVWASRYVASTKEAGSM